MTTQTTISMIPDKDGSHFVIRTTWDWSIAFLNLEFRLNAEYHIVQNQYVALLAILTFREK